VAAPELPRVGRGSSSHGDTCHLWSCSEPGAGTRATGTRGGSGAVLSREQELKPRGHVAAPSWEREPEPWRHVTASELTSGGKSRCLNLKLVRGVSDRTDNIYPATVLVGSGYLDETVVAVS
jgi:hypothetical protein